MGGALLLTGMTARSSKNSVSEQVSEASTPFKASTGNNSLMAPPKLATAHTRMGGETDYI